MSTVIGSWVPSSSANARMRLILDYTVVNTSNTVTRVYGFVSVAAGYSFNDSDNTFATSGSLVGSSTSSKSLNVPTNGSQTLYTFDINVPRGTSASTRSMAFSLTGINYVGASQKATVSATVAIPAIPAPTTPTGLVITRVSPSRIRLTWGGGQVQVIQVARRELPGVVGGSFRSYETLGSGNRSSGVEYDVATGYEWVARVARINSGIQSPWAYQTTGGARLFDAPTLPSSVSTVRERDNFWLTSITAFANNPSKPIVDVNVERERLSGGLGKWSAVGYGLSGNTRNFADPTNMPDDRVRYRVQFANAAGGSSWVYGPYVSGTPKAASSVAAGRSGATDFLVSFINNSLSANVFDVVGQSSSDGGVTWSGFSTISGHTGITPPGKGVRGSRTITGLNATLLWRFAIDMRTTTPALSTRSGTSNTVQAIQPPAAATPLAPMVTQLTGSTARFRWRHNALDGSAQTSAQLLFRVNGGSWTLRTITGTTDYRDEVLGTAGTVDWYVRTKGAHSSYGPDSATSSFLVANAPSVGISSPAPGSAFTSNKVVLTVSFADTTGAAMTSYVARLYGPGGELLEQVSKTGSTSSVAFAKLLANETAYTAEFEAVSGTGLRSNTAVTSFTTAWVPPTPPTVSVVWDDERGYAEVSITNNPAMPVTEVARNRALNPDAVSETGWVLADVEYQSRTMNVPVPSETPVGAGTCVESRVASGVTGSTHVMNLMNIDGLGTSAAYTRRVGAWVMVNEPGYRARLIGANDLGASYETIPPGIWVWLATDVIPANTDTYLHVQNTMGYVSGTARAWATGAMSWMEGESSGLNFTGDRSPDPTLVASWTGTPNNSASVLSRPATVATDSNNLYRSDDDGETWEPVAIGLGLDITTVDRQLPLNWDVLYRAAAVSVLGVEAYDQAHVFTTSRRAWLGVAGDLFDIILDLNVSYTDEQEVVLEDYLGSSKPTAHYGEGRPTQVSLSGTLTARHGLNTPWRLLFGQDVFVRTPDGRAFWGTVAGSIGRAGEVRTRRTISLTATEVEHDG